MNFRKDITFLIITFIVALLAIGGYVISNKIVKNKAQNIEQTSSTIQNEIANWKTYQNEKYGFEFKYPADHTPYSTVKADTLIPALSESTHVSIAENEAALFCCEPITFNVRVLNESASPYDWITKSKPALPKEKIIKIIFLGREAVEVIGAGNLGENYKILVIKDGDHLVVISQNAQSEILDSVFSSFKFSDSKSSVDTSSWKTYQNDKYGFEFKYPATWYYNQGFRGDTQYLICLNPLGSSGDCTAVLTVNWNVDFEDRLNAMKSLFIEKYSVEESIIQVDGVDGKLLKINNPGGFTRLLFWEKGGYLYNLQATEDLFSQILPTFKFIK